MRNFRKFASVVILLTLKLSEAQSVLESKENQNNGQVSEIQDIKYDRKYSVGDIDIPFGLIPSDYNSFELPPGPRNTKGAVLVGVRLSIFSAPDFKEEKEELSLDLRFIVKWRDNRFDHYANYSKSLVDRDGKLYMDVKLLGRIWHPHMSIIELKSNAQTSLMGAPTALEISPQNNSILLYRLRSTIQTACETDYMFYPFDVVVCPMQIFHNSHNHSDVNLSYLLMTSNKLKVPGFQVFLPIWKRGDYSYQTSNYSELGFRVLLRRDVTSIVIQTYIPSLILIIICFGSFTLTEVGDRVSCASLSLLSLLFLLGSVGTTPQGPYVTYLHKWVLMCILIVFLPLVEIFISLKLKTLGQRRTEEYRKQKVGAKREEDDEKMDVEAPSVNNTSKTVSEPKTGERESKLLKTVLLLEAATPAVVPCIFLLYNIYYWYALINGSHQKFLEAMGENITFT